MNRKLLFLLLAFATASLNAQIPTLITNATRNITVTSATAGGTITNEGGATVTARGVCWSTSSNPSIELSTKTSDGDGTGTFTSSISGLSASTTYFVRAYATNSYGTAYGAEVSGSGITNVQRTLATDRNWWYLASPVSAATSNVFAPAASTNKIGYYVENQETPNYSSPFAVGSATPLVVGAGYVVKLTTGGGDYTFTGGSLNNGTYNLTPTRTGTTAGKRGFNLIGNPYPSYLNFVAAYSDATNPAVNMRNAIWFRTFDKVTTENPTGMIFHTYSDGEGVPATVSGKIAPMQAFWVKVDKDNTAASLTFKNTHCSHFTEGSNALKVKANDDKQRVRLVLSDGKSQDEMLIVGKSYATDVLDAYDIEKMSNDNPEIPEIYSLFGTNQLVINSTSPIVANKEVKLGIRPSSTGTFTIAATQIQNIPSDIQVLLKDLIIGSETELTEGIAYPFNTGVAVVNDRFSIQFRAKGSTTGYQSLNSNLFVYSMQGSIMVQDSNLEGATVSVFNTLGQMIFNSKATSQTLSIDQKLTPGVYLIRVNNELRKVIVR